MRLDVEAGFLVVEDGIETGIRPDVRDMRWAVRAIVRSFKMKTWKPFGKGLAADRIRVSLCDRNPEVAHALANAFQGVAGLEVVEGDLLALDADAVVSPANSFGFMDGGLDAQIDAFYKGKAQPAVLALIRDQYYGELPVGSAAVLPMGGRHPGHLIVAPTMRVPGDDLRGTLNAYLAARAAFAAVLDWNRSAMVPIRHIALPGLGTGIGGLPPDDAAVQLRAAHDMILGGGWRSIEHPVQAPFVMGRG